MSDQVPSPIDSPRRIRGVDLARGFAVIGMIAVHLIDTPLLEISRPATWIALANGNASVLFATLAGVSLALANGGATPPTGPRLARGRRHLFFRGIVIWVIGVVLIFTGVPVNIILTAYGLLFVLATALLGLRVPALLLIAAVLTVTMPFLVAAINADSPAPSELGPELIGWYYPFPVWIIYVALGLAAGRILRSRPSPAAPALALSLVGAALAVLSRLVFDPLAARADAGGPDWLGVFTVTAHSSGIGNIVGASGVALFALGVSVLLCLTPARWVLWPLRAVGAMPLTAYVAHILVWFGWLVWANASHGVVDPLADFRATDPFWPTVVGLLVGCSLWMALLGRGLLERLVTWATVRLTAAR